MYLFCGWAQKQSVPLMAQGCLHRLRYLKLAEILSRLFHSLPGLWVPLWKGVFVPQLLHHLCQAAVGITASPNHLLPISVQVPKLLPSGILLEPVFGIFDHIGFLPLGRWTHCGRKKKIKMDYIGIAWLKCYQLCVGAGSSVTAGRKGRKMPTLLAEKTRFVKFKSAFRPESRVILIKVQLAERQKRAGREPRLSATSFSYLGSIEPGYGSLGVNKCTKQAHLGALRLW